MNSHDLENKYSNHDELTSLQRGGESWRDFFNGVFASVRNKDLDKFPYSKLNNNQSISFYIHKCDEKDCGECKEARLFEEAFKTDYIVEQLDLYRKKLNFPLVADKSQLIEINDTSATTNVIEYRLNITPENFDSILKLSERYAYRGPDNILKIRKDCQIKPGSIYLFPVAQLDEKTFTMRAAGCQISEMPTVQLLHLLPNFDGLEKYFHWVPNEVSEQLSLNQGDIETILSNLLSQQKMIENHFYIQSAVGDVVISSGNEGPIKIVDMDDKARDFYLLYGNCSYEELKEYKSLEINTKDFYLHIFKHLKEKFNYYKTDQYFIDHSEMQMKYLHEILDSLNTVLTMIKSETSRIERLKNSIAKSPTSLAPHATLNKSLQSENAAESPAILTEYKQKKSNF